VPRWRRPRSPPVAPTTPSTTPPAALAVHEGTGYRRGQADAHAVLARLHGAADRPGPAHDHRRRAGTIYAEIGAPEAVDGALPRPAPA
jgi:hypothetical protein